LREHRHLRRIVAWPVDRPGALAAIVHAVSRSRNESRIRCAESAISCVNPQKSARCIV
jgi:hypothetical protein